jgi:hypothetical protein
VVLVALAVVGACSTERFDRAAAVDSVLARYGDRLTRDQAECYVNRVVDELGSDALDDESTRVEHVARLTRIRVDCVGVTSLGTSIPPSSRPRTGGGTAPVRIGDDPALDQLQWACAAGSGTACDELFDQAPLGSEYEDFALTCGGRTSELSCAQRYPG